MKKKLLFSFLVLPFLTAYGQDQWGMDSIAKYLDFSYKISKEYTQSFGTLIFKTSDYPKRLSRTYDAKWKYKDNECIVYLKDGGMSYRVAIGFQPKPDKSETEIHDTSFNRIGIYLGITSLGRGLSPIQREKLDSIIKIWPEKKAKEWFNAQHVIEYPDGEKDVVYEGGYRAKRSLCIIKWGQYIEINFLVTEKGYKNIDKYMKGFKKAFWFND